MIRFLNWIGFYKKDGKTKIDWRTIYYWFALTTFIYLGFDAFFIEEVTWDNWGLTSPYIIKTFLIGLSLFVIYYVWGYNRLVRKVIELGGDNK